MLLKTYNYLFFLCLAADIAAIFSGWQAGHFLFKFLLMPILITALLQHKKNEKQKNWRLVFAGLIMAWAGDVLLLFSASRPLFFILGLVCFLCTHIAYIVYFYRYHLELLRSVTGKPLLTIAILAYAIILLAILWPSLGNLRIPVVIYTLVISLMVLQAVAAGKCLEAMVAGLFVSGAIIFVISDSILAFDKFYRPFTGANVAVMLTYGVAQWLIVKGTIGNSDSSLQRAGA